LISQDLLRCLPSSGTGIILIAGGIRSGKSVLAYGLAEAFKESGRALYAYNFPQQKVELLPDFITPTYDINFPEHSIVIADEAYMALHSKNQNTDVNKFFDLLSGLVGQKDCLVLFLTQTTRKLTLASVSSAQVLLVKCPDIMMVKLDRSELRSILRAALEEYRKLENEQRQRAVYVVSMDYEGLLTEANSPPIFWTEELSRAWQGVPLQEREEPMSSQELQEALTEYQELLTFQEAYGELGGLDRLRDDLKKRL